MKVCVVTSVGAAAEPRAPRHALAAREAFPDAEVVFVDHQPLGVDADDPPSLSTARVKRLTVRYPWGRRGRLSLARRKLAVAATQRWAKATGQVGEAVFGPAMVGLSETLRRERADIYWAHNIETLLPAARAAEAAGGKLLFDCMEYYSDMGDGQPAAAAAAAKSLEARWLPRCALVTASSETLAEVLAAEYAIPAPLALYNTPAVTELQPRERSPGLRLYWRNAVVGLSQRGLDDALVALTLCPPDVVLTVQGRAASDGGERVRARIEELGLSGRVTILGPFAPGQAVQAAAAYDVGLCLERRGPLNHEYTVSNKLFDYLMAGLAVVVADLPGLRTIADRSAAGLLFEPGSPQALAAQLIRLRGDRQLLERLSDNARAFALAEGNLDVDMTRLRSALAVLSP